MHRRRVVAQRDHLPARAPPVSAGGFAGAVVRGRTCVDLHFSHTHWRAKRLAPLHLLEPPASHSNPLSAFLLSCNQRAACAPHWRAQLCSAPCINERCHQRRFGLAAYRSCPLLRACPPVRFDIVMPTCEQAALPKTKPARPGTEYPRAHKRCGRSVARPGPGSPGANETDGASLDAREVKSSRGTTQRTLAILQMNRFAGLSQRAGQSLALTFGSDTPNVHVLRASHAQQDDTPDQFPASGIGGIRKS